MTNESLKRGGELSRQIDLLKKVINHYGGYGLSLQGPTKDEVCECLAGLRKDYFIDLLQEELLQIEKEFKSL